jgi:exodeoxyribonuclease VII small subunit
MTEESLNFEKSFARLEEILNKMNSGKVSLDESLKLYEEADQLISLCSTRLDACESKIEMLMKKRNGELETNDSGKPLLKEFQFQE